MNDPVYFLTRPNGHKLGEPTVARPCRCARPLVDDEGGCFCGYWTEATIRETWDERRRRMVRRPAHGGVPARRHLSLV